MEKIRVAVCEDEQNIRDYLSALIMRQGMECEIAEYASAEAYLSDGKEHDLVFLDIELAGSSSGMDGMHLARHIRSARSEAPVIIFVTGHEKYVYDAFDVGAFQYLLKPVDERRFAEVFQRAAQQIAQERQQRKRKLFFRYDGKGITLPLDDIFYMESQGHKIIIHLKDGKAECYTRMGDLEKELQGQFFRIHKGYLINMNDVDTYGRTEVTLTDGHRLPVSKYKYEDFVRAYQRFLRQTDGGFG